MGNSINAQTSVTHLNYMNMAREDLVRKTGTSKVRGNVAKRKFGWIGHVLRMDNTGICTTPLT